MLPFFEDYLERLQALHQEIHQILHELPEEAFDWSPGPALNSVAVLVTHLTGAERFWVGDVARGETSARVREEEFQVVEVGRAGLIARLEQSIAYIKKAAADSALADLEIVRHTPNQDRSVTIGWCYLHALEHTAVHTGQIQLMADWWQRHQE